MCDSGTTTRNIRASDSNRRRGRAAGLLDRAVLAHLGLLGLVTAWAFGGQSPEARTWLLIWTTVGVGLFFVALGVLDSVSPGTRRRALSDLWPLLLFDTLVLAAATNPTFRMIMREQIPYFIQVDPPRAWLPSSARPDLALRHLWLLNGILISSYNAFLTLRSRQQIRLLLFVLAGNAVVLAVFGTFQHLLGSPGLYFGLVKTPQEYFFATFVYHNHWGAYILLATAASLGLLHHAWRRQWHRDVWHSPMPAGAVVALLLAATIPLSGSRSSTALLCLLMFGAVTHLLIRVRRQRRSRHESALLPVAGILLAVLLASGAISDLARDVIVRRAELTSRQLEHLLQEDRLDSRLTLYRDTIRMGMTKPWFGWGLESYGDVFRIYNSQRAVEVRFGQPYYRYAHSDWLQSFAENGAVGTILIVLLGLLPLRHARWSRVSSSLPFYLLAGCATILLYAWMEFPFANPSVLVSFWTCLYLAGRYASLDIEAQSEERSD